MFILPTGVALITRPCDVTIATIDAAIVLKHIDLEGIDGRREFAAVRTKIDGAP
jgi:hypothetical protein